MRTIISSKQYSGVYREIEGVDLKYNIELYNDALKSDAKISEDVLFIVYTDDDGLKADNQYLIYGLGFKQCFWGLHKATKFVYIVELYDDELYYQNSEAGRVKGKVIEKQKYKMNFCHQDMDKDKNTFIKFIRLVGYNTQNIRLEIFAIQRYDIKLLENIFRYKKLYYDDYSYEDYKILKNIAIKGIKITNVFRDELLEGLKSIDKFDDLGNYIKSNNAKFLDESDLMYERNDNMNNYYPTNMVGGIVNVNLYDNFSFNSAMPFYYQYRNYQFCVGILAEKFYDVIENGENIKFENNIKIMHWLYGKQEEFDVEKPKLYDVNTTLYGLYFPLLMNFRQSVELAFKLIFINEDLKKQQFTNRKELNNYAKEIKSHDLPLLLKKINPYIDDDVYQFLLKLSSFIYYSEGTDASFSRFLIDKDLDFNSIRPISIYYVDLYNYINEFYSVMEEVFENIDFGFELKNVFTK